MRTGAHGTPRWPWRTPRAALAGAAHARMGDASRTCRGQGARCRHGTLPARRNVLHIVPPMIVAQDRALAVGRATAGGSRGAGPAWVRRRRRPGRRTLRPRSRHCSCPRGRDWPGRRYRRRCSCVVRSAAGIARDVHSVGVRRPRVGGARLMDRGCASRPRTMGLRRCVARPARARGTGREPSGRRDRGAGRARRRPQPGTGALGPAHDVRTARQRHSARGVGTVRPAHVHVMCTARQRRQGAGAAGLRASGEPTRAHHAACRAVACRARGRSRPSVPAQGGGGRRRAPAAHTPCPGRPHSVRRRPAPWRPTLRAPATRTRTAR